jgi:hypothetical protein
MRRVVLTPHQERLVEQTVAGVAAPHREDFRRDVLSRLAGQPADGAVWAAVAATHAWFQARQVMSRRAVQE